MRPRSLRGLLADRWPSLLLASLSVVYGVATCLRAAKEKLWFDEIFTVYATALPSFHALWSFLCQWVPGPPLSYVVVGWSEHVFGTNAFGVRLPSIVAFWVMAVCLYVYLGRRLPAPFAIAGMLFPALTASGRYSYEARPYALVLAFAGLALVAWQTAAEGRRRRIALPALAASLAAALCSHPMAVALALPFVVGEGTRTFRRRRLDLPMWFAFGAATPALLVLWRMKTVGNPVMYDHNNINLVQTVVSTYFRILMPSSLALGVALVLLLVRSAGPSSPVQGEQRMPRHELAALVGFALIPLAAVPLSALAGPYWPRYSLNCVIGLAGCLSVVLFRICGSRPLAGVTLMGIFAVFFALGQFSPDSNPFDTGMKMGNSSEAIRPSLERMPEPDVPIVVSDSIPFLELEYYSSARLAERLYYLTDPNGAVWLSGNTWFEVRGPLLKKFFPIRAHFEDYSSFIAGHKRFFVVGPALGVVPHLLADRAAMRVKELDDHLLYYEVTSQ